MDLLLISSNRDAIPVEYRHHRTHLGSEMAMFRVQVCNNCGKPIRDHIWFLIDRATDDVPTCSEVA